MVELKKLRIASLFLLVLPLLSCPNPFFEKVEALVSGVTAGQVSAPILSPGAGTYSVSQSVSITCLNAGATIHYTTDGSTPTLSSPTYSGPFLLSSPGATIKAFAVEPGIASSAVVSAVIEIGVSTQVAMPTISPAPGRIGHATKISMACTTIGATIAYTTDGSTPTYSAGYPVLPARPYPGLFTLPYGVTTVKALAFKTGMTDSPVASSVFTEPVFVYIGSASASAVYAEQVNLTDGSLSPAGTVTLGAGAQGLATDPAGRFLYVAADTPTPVSAFTIDPGSGALTSAGTMSVGSLLVSAAVEDTGQFLYTTTSGASGVTLYSINQSTGALSQIVIFAPSGITAGLAADPVGPYLYVALSNFGQVQGYSVAGDGILTTIAGTPISTGLAGTNSVVVDPLGRYLYAGSQSAGMVTAFSITPITGALTFIGQSPSCGSPVAVAIDPSGQLLYVADYSGSSIYGFRINSLTGALSLLFGPLGDPGGLNPVSLSIEPSGQFLYVAHGTSTGMTIFSINSSTGALTLVGTPSVGAYQSCVTSTGVAN